MKSLIILLFALFSVFVYAGNDNGGGGGVFLCGESTAKPYTLFLDLWEEQYIGNHPVLRTNTPFNEQIAHALKRLQKFDSQLAFTVQSYLKNMPALMHELDESVIINPPEDAKAKYSKKDCSLRGMIYFDDFEEKINVSPTLFALLETQTDVAAAWLHEALYKAGRTFYDHNDSIQTRRLVGCLFSSDESCLPVHNRALPEECEGPNVKFYRNPKKDVYAFVRINNLEFDYLYSANQKVHNRLNKFGFNTDVSVVELAPNKIQINFDQYGLSREVTFTCK
jgi:hypothetical protein